MLYKLFKALLTKSHGPDDDLKVLSKVSSWTEIPLEPPDDGMTTSSVEVKTGKSLLKVLKDNPLFWASNDDPVLPSDLEFLTGVKLDIENDEFIAAWRSTHSKETYPNVKRGNR